MLLPLLLEGGAAGSSCCLCREKSKSPPLACLGGGLSSEEAGEKSPAASASVSKLAIAASKASSCLATGSLELLLGAFLVLIATSGLGVESGCDAGRCCCSLLASSSWARASAASAPLDRRHSAVSAAVTLAPGPTPASTRKSSSPLGRPRKLSLLRSSFFFFFFGEHRRRSIERKTSKRKTFSLSLSLFLSLSSLSHQVERFPWDSDEVGSGALEKVEGEMGGGGECGKRERKRKGEH